MTSESVADHASHWWDSASVPLGKARGAFAQRPNAGFLRDHIFTNDTAGAGYSVIWVERCRR